MQMTAEEFDREKRYQVIMHFVRKMLRQGLITEEEYYQIDTKKRAKFLPITSDLLSGRTLLTAGHRGNMHGGKEA